MKDRTMKTFLRLLSLCILAIAFGACHGGQAAPAKPVIFGRVVPELQNNLVGQTSDVNSIVLGDVFRGEWQQTLSGATLFNRPNDTASNDAFPYHDCGTVNWPAQTSAFVLHRAFAPPPNVTAVAVEADALLPSGVVSSTIVLRVMDVTNTTVIGSGTCTLTSSVQTCTSGPVSVSAGTNYLAEILTGAGTGVSSGASADICRVRVRPTTTTSTLFGSPFVRYNADTGFLWDNGKSGTTNEQSPNANIYYRRQSAQSRFVFDTNANVIGVQLLNMVTPRLAGQGLTLVRVNGRPLPPITGASSTYDVQTVNLPPGLKRIEIENSDQYRNSGTPADFESELGAVFIPQTAWLNIIPPPKNTQRILIIGDSKTVGYGGTIPALTGWVALLKRYYPNISFIVDAGSSRAIQDDCYSTHLTAPNVIRSLAARYAQIQPDVIMNTGLGRNDWALSNFNPTYVEGMWGNCVDAIHAAWPHAYWIEVSTWPESAEAANGLGFTLPQYRNAVNRDMCTARGDWCRFVDGTTIPSYSPATFTTDGTHPNDKGHALIATFLSTLIDSFNLSSGPVPQAAFGEGVSATYFSTAVAASGGTFAPEIAAPASNESLLLNVAILVEDTTSHTSDTLVHLVRIQNNAGTITAGTPTAVHSDVANISIATAYSVSTNTIVLTVTNNGAHATDIKVVVTPRRVQ